MGLLSLFKRSESAPAARVSDEAIVERARSSARRRLIGAVVLLGIGVVAFPLIFETQPRPISVDIPIEIPRRDAAPPLALPAAKPPATPAPESKADAPREPAVVAAPSAPVSKAEAKVEAKPAPPKPEAKAADDAPGRFVVQVGAFAEAAAVREARARVDKLGLATYTQAVETASGARTRVRVGPFASRDEADKAAAKLKAAGLPGAVLAL